MKEVTLVVGADGFMGSALVQALVAQGRRTLAITRRRACIVQSPDIDLHLPESSEHWSELLEGAVAALWLASSTTPGSSAGDPIKELEGNLRPLLEFLKAWQKYPACRLLFVSTGGAVYGDGPGGHRLETDPLVSKSYYSAGKIAAEQFISACCQQFALSATILRPSNIYGHGQRYRPGFGIVPTTFRALLQGDPVTIWGDGGMTRDYLNIDDFVALSLRALDRPTPALAHTFNASSGEGTSIDSLLSMIESVTGYTIQREYRPTRAVDVSRIVPDNGAACSAFEWQPQISLERGLTRAWQWFKANTR